MSRSASVGVWVLCLCVLSSATVTTVEADGAPAGRPDAQEQDDALAREQFELGTQHFRRGEYEQAIVAYERAYALSPRPRLLFNLSLAHEKLGQYAEACDALVRYLKLADDVLDRAELEVRLSRLRERYQRQQAEAARANESGPRLELAGHHEVPARDSASQAAKTPLYRRWWLWTAVGVVVAGTVTGIAVAVTRDDPAPTSFQGNGATLMAY